MTSPGVVGEPFLAREVLTPMMGNSPVSFRSHNASSPPGCASAGTWFPWPDDAAAFGDAVKFNHHSFFNEIGQGLNDVGPLKRVLVLRQPNSLLMMSWMAMARRTLCSVGVVMASSYALVCNELQLS